MAVADRRAVRNAPMVHTTYTPVCTPGKEALMVMLERVTGTLTRMSSGELLASLGSMKRTWVWGSGAGAASDAGTPASGGAVFLDGANPCGSGTVTPRGWSAESGRTAVSRGEVGVGAR